MLHFVYKRQIRFGMPGSLKYKDSNCCVGDGINFRFLNVSSASLRSVSALFLLYLRGKLDISVYSYNVGYILGFGGEAIKFLIRRNYGRY